VRHLFGALFPSLRRNQPQLMSLSTMRAGGLNAGAHRVGLEMGVLGASRTSTTRPRERPVSASIRSVTFGFALRRPPGAVLRLSSVTGTFSVRNSRAAFGDADDKRLALVGAALGFIGIGQGELQGGLLLERAGHHQENQHHDSARR